MAKRRGTVKRSVWQRIGAGIGYVGFAVWLGFLAFGWIDGLVENHSSGDDSGANAFTISSMHTDYKLTRDAAHHADLDVTETITAQFSDDDLNHGILRAIPRTADGRSLHLEVYDVTDGAHEVQFDKENQGAFTVLKIGDPYEYVHGAQTYVITYSMSDVVQQQVFGGGQRFNYDVNGTGWAVAFDEVSATLHVPRALAGDLSGDTACYQGAQGSTRTCDITHETTASGTDFTASATNLAAHENATMIVGFKPGTFSVPFSIPRLLVWILLGVAVVVLGLAVLVRFRSLGNPKGTGIIVPQYEAFPGIGVMEASELLDERDRAFPALVTELVVAQAATMRRDAPTGKGGQKSSDEDDIYQLQLLDAQRLDDDDSTAVATLFGSLKRGKQVRLDPASAKVGERVRKLLVDAEHSVRKQGLIARRHTRASTTLFVLGWVLPFLAIALGAGIISTGLSSLTHNIALGAVIVFGIAAIVFAWPRERLTDKAMPAYEHLLGIRDYVKLAEADRIKMLQSPEGAETAEAPDGTQIVKLYEKLLPYAILFGIEKEWREVLGRYWATTPTDVSPTLLPLQTVAFTSAFASSNYTAATVNTGSGSNSWSSSGGSSSFSSGGGGSSGGGFGGGGGGGW